MWRKVIDEPLVAWARALLVKQGQVYISKELAATIKDIAARLRDHQPVAVAEVRLVEEQLRATPGFTEMEASDLLNRTLKTKAIE